MKYILYWAVILSSVSVSAQTRQAYLQAGDRAYASGQYRAAYVYFQQAEELDSSPELSYRIARAAYAWQAYDVAVARFRELPMARLERTAPPIRYEWGLAEQRAGHYAEAITQWRRFLQNRNASDSLRTEARRLILDAEWAMQVRRDSSQVRVQHSPKGLNSPYNDFAPTVFAGRLFYSSLRYKEKIKGGEEAYFSRILEADTSGMARGQLVRGLNQKGLHNAHTAFSPDGEWVVFTRCETLPSGEKRCDLYQKAWNNRRDRGVKMEINVPQTTHTQPAFGYDKSGTIWLYFVSNRSGGMGKLDLWRVRWMDGATVGAPEPLTALNTPQNDITPYYHASSQTLYFSTDGRRSMGGYDIWKSDWTGSWQAPQHLGSPLNTSYDDLYFMAADSLATRGWLASNRLESERLHESACCNDLWRWERVLPPPVPVDTPPVVTEIDTIPTLVSHIEIDTLPFEQLLADILPLSLYFDNDQPLPRSLDTVTTLPYSATVAAYQARKEVFEQRYAAMYRGEAAVLAKNRMQSFFVDTVQGRYNQLQEVLALLKKELESGREIKIYIRGFASKLAGAAYNINLSKRRISSVINELYLPQYGLTSYLESGQLQCIEVPFGEWRSRESADVIDSTAAVYGVGASRERRVEIIEVTALNKE